jgi:Tat protein translocase TatB subunit
MPSVGPTEVLLVLLIALLVLGPHKLPEMARQLGRGIRQFREAARNVTREMGAEDLVDDLKELNQARGTFGETVRKELGLDELGAFPDISDVVDPKPDATAAHASSGAATADVSAAAAAAVVTDVPTAGPAESLPAEAPAAETSEPASAKPVRKRTPRAKLAETAGATPAEAAEAVPAKSAKPVRKRTPRAKLAETPTTVQTEAVPAAPATPKPARTRTAKAKTSEPV